MKILFKDVPARLGFLRGDLGVRALFRFKNGEELLRGIGRACLCDADQLAVARAGERFQRYKPPLDHVSDHGVDRLLGERPLADDILLTAGLLGGEQRIKDPELVFGKLQAQKRAPIGAEKLLGLLVDKAHARLFVKVHSKPPTGKSHGKDISIL